jgi:hypothetical protein
MMAHEIAHGSYNAIEVELIGVTTRRGDHFVGMIPSLGIVAFGSDVTEARDRAEHMFHALFDEIADRAGFDAAIDRLNEAGIRWTAMSEGSWTAPLRIAREGGVPAPSGV